MGALVCLGFARTARLIAGGIVGVTDFVLDRAERPERRVWSLPVVEDLKLVEDRIGQFEPGATTAELAELRRFKRENVGLRQ